MLFKDIIGRQEIKQKLIEMVAHNRLSHALLFLGKEGSGALPLAITFANYVCLNSTTTSAANDGGLFGDAEEVKPVLPQTPDDADAFMQKHSSYTKIKELIHPDIHFTYPVIPKKSGEKPISTDYITQWRSFIAEQPYGNVYDWLQFLGAENKQGNITAAECNEIVRKLSLKSYESGYKILILWIPEFLGKEGNKLLKLIEEPPADTLFILVAENDDQILNTILSRTQLIKVPLAEDEEIVQYLRQNADVVKAMQATMHCGGNIREAIHFLNHVDTNWLSLVKDCFNAVLKTGPLGMNQWVLSLSELGREKQKQFLKFFIQLIEHGIKAHILGINAVIMPDEERDFLEKLVKKIKPDQLEMIAELLNDNIYYIERNANAKLLFHAVIIRIYHIIANNSVILVQ